jgi:hypothetical protein
MKSLIKQLLRESLLTEKLTNIDDDVILIYNNFFASDITKLENTGIISDDIFLETKTNTSILKTKEAIIAHELNPCEIWINAGTNYYYPENKIISISLNSNAIKYVKNSHNRILKKAIDYQDYDMSIMLAKEFTEEKIKGSIHHELAHWIDDTINNRHLTKRLNKAKELNTRDIGGIPINATKMEIQAQIHNIKQLHNKYSNIWDNLSFYDMIKYSPPLFLVYLTLKGDTKTKWIRDLKTRMHREGLLGKNMTVND